MTDEIFKCSVCKKEDTAQFEKPTRYCPYCLKLHDEKVAKAERERILKELLKMSLLPFQEEHIKKLLGD